MGTTEDVIQFLGDLSDPWVAAIADGLPASQSVERVDCPGDIPDQPFDPGYPPRLIIVHRQHGTTGDARRLKSWRDLWSSSTEPALFLCFSPYYRHEELERVSPLFDQMIPEATAHDVLPGRVARFLDRNARPLPGTPITSFRIEIVCGNGELGQVLVERCGSAGFGAVLLDDTAIGEGASSPVSSASTTERVLTIWDVPVLTESWPERLQTRARTVGPVIALMGFADRAIVETARSMGACACLDLPFDNDDLLDAIDRVGRSISVDRWPMPTRAEAPHVLPPRSRRRVVPLSACTSAVNPAMWPDRGPPSTMV